jgi:hypothetical protein
MKLFLLLVLAALAAACGGDSFTSEALSLAPDSGAVDAAQVPPTSDGDGRRGEAGPVDTDSLGSGASEAAARDVLADPWPADVVVEPVPPPICQWGSAVGCPCTNCWLFDRPDGSTDHTSCCGAFVTPNDSDPRVVSNLCGSGDFPSPHRAYCDSCACHP